MSVRERKEITVNNYTQDKTKVLDANSANMMLIISTSVVVLHSCVFVAAGKESLAVSLFISILALYIH